jgi:tetratricopeptide (TPR) repeat protein
VLAQPSASAPLDHLARLYRARDGNLDRAIADFETRAAAVGSGQFAAIAGLAGLYKLAGRPADAQSTYERALAIKPAEPTTLQAVARLYEEAGDRSKARNAYARALGGQSALADKEQTLRSLMKLALDASDWDDARAWHQQMVGLEPTRFFIRSELGHELYARGEFARASAELGEAVAAATGDNRALAPALKELGLAQTKAHDSRAALATLQRALVLSAGQGALRGEIYEAIADLYRADQQLPALIAKLETTGGGDVAGLALLGRLYEETGDGSRAAATYRRALALAPRQIDLRLHLIRLMQSDGDLDRVVAEYEALIQVSPDNPQFVFEECDALLERGERSRAERLLARLEQRAAGDDEALSRLADFYGRMGDSKGSLRVLQHLADSAPSSDGSHLVDLGDRYYQDGDVAQALRTWRRIPLQVSPRAKALGVLGDVLLEHDMVKEATAAYQEAVQLDPASLASKKALAGAYDRAREYDKATNLYEEVLRAAAAQHDRPLARDCRSHIVTLWGLNRVLERRVVEVERRFRGPPPDVEAGRLLAEAQLHLRRLGQAEDTLRRVIALAPGDAEAYLTLERALVQDDKIAEALQTLEALVQVDPARSREVYERMAQYALRMYRDDDAVRYAVRAVELNPDDSEGHRRLAELYRSKQDIEHAIVEFRTAIAKNERQFVVYFELADLLLAKGRTEEADRLFRSVVRGARDDELIARAARLSMQINLGKGTLQRLEDDLVPLAIGSPQKSIYRKLLVQVCGSLAFDLIERAQNGTNAERTAARAVLTRIGAQAVKPLLDALAGDDVGQQRIAIDVLGYVDNPHAALPLFTFATGKGDVELRTRAMVACGLLADAHLLQRYEDFLFGGAQATRLDGADPVAAAAVWGLARIGLPQAVPLLRRLAFAEGASGLQGMAIVGLGVARDNASLPRLAGLLRSSAANATIRAAAAAAMGSLGTPAQVQDLLQVAEEGEALPRAMALVALARLAAGRPPTPWSAEAVRACANAFFASTGDDSEATDGGLLERAAIASFVALSGTSSSKVDALKMPVFAQAAATPAIETVLSALVPSAVPADALASAMASHADAMVQAAVTELETSPAGVHRVLDVLSAGSGPTATSAEAAEPAGVVGGLISARVVLHLAPLAQHPDPQLRAQAIALLGREPPSSSLDVVTAALGDDDERVRHAALASLASVPITQDAGAPVARAVEALGGVLERDPTWSLRVQAARALGHIGSFGREASARALAAATGHDPYALVRQAALEALAQVDPARAKDVATHLASTDAEPRVREAAAAMSR